MEVHGNVCDKLCEASPHSCSPMHSGKSVVFRTSVGGLKVSSLTIGPSFSFLANRTNYSRFTSKGTTKPANRSPSLLARDAIRRWRSSGLWSPLTWRTTWGSRYRWTRLSSSFSPTIGKFSIPTVRAFNSIPSVHPSANNVGLFVFSAAEPGYQHSLMETMWALVQDAEYVFSAIFGKLELFPKLLGSCGTLYLSEELEPLPSSGFFGGRKG